MDFRSTHVFSVKEAENSVNGAAGGIINCRTHRNSLCRDKNKLYVTSYMMVYKAINHVLEVSPAPTVAKDCPTPVFYDVVSDVWGHALY
jgi:hypothetical protein